MDEQELVRFIAQIKRVGGSDEQRIDSALASLLEILRRQRIEEEKLQPLAELVALESFAGMCLVSKAEPKTMDDVRTLIEAARHYRHSKQIEDAHRGCR